MRLHVSRHRTDRGAAAVEFALILPVLFLVIAGIVDLGRAMYTQSIVTNAAREGARAAIASSATAGDVTTRATAAAPEVTGLVVVPATCTVPGDDVAVVVQAPFDWVMLGPALSLIPGGGDALPDTLDAEAVMRCM